MNQVMIAWVIHELNAAMDKAADGNFDVASGAVHNWDEAWAFYHGSAPAVGWSRQLKNEHLTLVPPALTESLHWQMKAFFKQ